MARLWNRSETAAGETHVLNPDADADARVDADSIGSTETAEPVVATDVAPPAPAGESVVRERPMSDRTLPTNEPVANVPIAEPVEAENPVEVEDPALVERPADVDPDMQEQRIPTSRPSMTEEDRTGAERDRDAADAALEAPDGRVRGSFWANIGVVISVAGLCATLTGLLAPEGLVLGAIGLVISVGGFRAGRRPGVTGSGAATLGLVIGLAAIVLAVLAMTGNYSWPNSKTDEIKVWHDWLVSQWSWLKRF